MKKNSYLAALALFFFNQEIVLAGNSYQINSSNSNITWNINSLLLPSFSGNFTRSEGILEFDESHPENSKITVTIFTNSITSKRKSLEEDLKGKDFFDVEKFPSASFKSTAVKMISANKAEVYGDFTMLGVTKPIILDVTLSKIETDADGKKTAGFTAATSLKRSLFGMTYGTTIIPDEVKIDIDAETNLSAVN